MWRAGVAAFALLPSLAQGQRSQSTTSGNLLSSVHLTAAQRSALNNHQGDWDAFNDSTGAAAGFGPVTRYGTVRWAEDWSALQDPALRKADNDPFDKLKYIPLAGNGSIYLSLSGSERLKNWFENRPGLGVISQNDSGRMALQSIYGADLHLGAHVRLYGEILNASAGGWNGYGYTAGYRSRLDLQQAFAEFRGKVFGAKAGIMVGRMDFIDAPDYVFYARTVSSVPESWNGFRAYLIWPHLRFDIFDFVQTNINPPAMFHDVPSYKTRLYGVYGSYALPRFKCRGKMSKIYLDLFYYGWIFNGDDAAITAPLGIQDGATHRDNYGARLWGSAGPVEFSLGALYQSGVFTAANTESKRPVSAYSLNESIGWHFSGLPMHPLLGLQGDLYSGGNRNRTDGTIGTYTTPFVPLSSYLDTSYYTGTSNLIAISPIISMAPTSFAKVQLKAPVLWRASTRDAFYAPGGPYTFTRFHGGYVGVVPQAQVSLHIGRHLTWNHDFARFFVSTGLSRAGASNSFYYLSTLTFEF